MTDNQKACIDLLKDALAEAEEGRISACALVLCMTGGWATALAGNRPGDLNLGLDDLKGKILDAVTDNANVNRKKSHIMRVS